MKTPFIVLITLTIGLTACSSLVDPVTRAQDLIKRGKLSDAIYNLEKEYKKRPDSVPIKSILARAYSDYGLAICQDESKLPKVKYKMAKEQFAMALALNPYLTDAKEMYELIEKIQASITTSKLD